MNWQRAVPFTRSLTLLVFLVWLASPCAAGSQEALKVTITDAVSIEETGELQLFVTVTGPESQPLPSLGAENFAITETPLRGGEPQQIADFRVQSEKEARAAAGEEGPQPPPLSIALAIDTSESMAGSPLDQAKTAAVDFVNGRPDGDEIALYSFSTQVALVEGFTTNKSAVNARIVGLEAGGKTALYEAIRQVATAVKGRGQRQAFVVLTDGQNDSDPPPTMADAKESARQAEAPGYMLGYGFTADEVLESIAQDTGGRYLERPREDGIRGLLDDLSTIMNQYVLTYLPPPSEGESPPEQVNVRVVARTGEGDGSSFLIVRIQRRPMPDATATPDCPPDDPACPPEEELPVGLIALVGLSAVAAGGALYFARRRRHEPDLCPLCGRLMEPEWVECLFCAQEDHAQEWETPTRPDVPLPRDESPATPPGVVPPAHHPPRDTRMLPEAQKTRRMRRLIAWLAAGDQDFPLDEHETTIGRAPGNDILLDDPTVSGQHAKIRVRDGAYYLYDLSRTNPTLVNGQEHHGKKLEPGDRIEFGEVELVFNRLDPTQ